MFVRNCFPAFTHRRRMLLSAQLQLSLRKSLALILAAAIGVGPAMAQSGTVHQTPVTPMELPVEVEIELAPATSLKQAPLWKELIQLLRNPNAQNCTPNVNRPGMCVTTNAIQRRSFSPGPDGILGNGDDVRLPGLNVWPLGYNFLTAQPLWLRTSDGEISWDQPGPLFDPEEEVPTDQFNVPTQIRETIGALVSCSTSILPAPEQPQFGGLSLPCLGAPPGSLVVSNPPLRILRNQLGFSSDSPNCGPLGLTCSDPRIPPHRTVVGMRAFRNNSLQELGGAGVSTTATVPVEELEIPVNEEDFFRTGTAAIPAPLQAYVGRRGAEVLGKALFWDMQVGGDGVQSCGSCHFHAGADNRTKNQLNPNHIANTPDGQLEVTGPNSAVTPAHFPFRRLTDPDAPSEGPGASAVEHDFNDVMSSMGVSRFATFLDIPPIGGNDNPATTGGAEIEGSFGPGTLGVRPLVRDRADFAAAEPLPQAFIDSQGRKLRRVEPRNTPTMHAAAFNFDNFWDGRARFAFNGGSVQGASDPTPHIFISPGGALVGATMGDMRPDLLEEDPELAEQPVRIKFSSLASQAVGPPLSDFEMSFAGRNWAKIGKKLLQGEPNATAFGTSAPQQAGTEPATTRIDAVVPLANQLVATNDSILGPFSNQGGSVCQALEGLAAGAQYATAPGTPGLCIAYGDVIRVAFAQRFWNVNGRHLTGAVDSSDPFDAYTLTDATGGCNVAACRNDTNQFRQIEANFSLFFGLAAQAYEQLLIPDHTPFDRFMDANPLAANGIGQPGEQAVLFPTLIRSLINPNYPAARICPAGTTLSGHLCLIPDDPATAEYDGFGPDEIFGFDIFAGGNLTAALAVGSARNPAVQTPSGTYGLGSNPFTRNARCMLCHLGPEQTDHSINIAHGLLKGDAEFEFPTPPETTILYTGPGGNTAGVVIPPPSIIVPAPEPPGPIATVGGLILAEEVEESAQDAVEVEPRNFAIFDDPNTSWDDRVVGQPSNFAFGDQGIYNVGVRPSSDDLGRGGTDAFGWPLSLSALALINVAGDGSGGPAEDADDAFNPCDNASEMCVMGNVDPEHLGGTFEESGGDLPYPGAPLHSLQSINPGFERTPITELLPEYMADWLGGGMPAGELHPEIDEMAGLAPNTITPPNGGPAVEFPEVIFGADEHCGTYNPAVYGAGSPNFGWGAVEPVSGGTVLRHCPNNQSGVSGNFEFPVHGTWPVPNRVLRDGAFKAPPLRNVELTGPYFHTGSYLTLRQVVDFYLRGGDFPVTNEDSRDPQLVNVAMQAFGFGRTAGDGLGDINSGFLVGNIGDALPDTVYLYDAMPDTNHPLTPEPSYLTLENAKEALVKLLLAFTDPRVKYERAPFDRPEMFIPIDGLAPENTGGRPQLLDQSNPSDVCDGVACFLRIPAVGFTGNADPLPNFLGVASTPGAGCDHFDTVCTN
jgi:cytochrome c peroxidase